MCECLIAIKDIPGFDPIGNALADRPGDVIVVCPDGWGWTPLEMTNPNWCILKMPGVPASSIKPMVDPVLNTAGKVVAKHAQNFNLAAPALTIVSPGGVVIAATALAQSQIMAAAVVKNVAAITVG